MRSGASARGIHFRLREFRRYFQNTILQRGMDAAGINRIGKIEALKYPFCADSRQVIFGMSVLWFGAHNQGVRHDDDLHWLFVMTLYRYVKKDRSFLLVNFPLRNLEQFFLGSDPVFRIVATSVSAM